jgi:hypothetical protein
LGAAVHGVTRQAAPRAHAVQTAFGSRVRRRCCRYGRAEGERGGPCGEGRGPAKQPTEHAAMRITTGGDTAMTSAAFALPHALPHHALPPPDSGG